MGLTMKVSGNWANLMEKVNLFGRMVKDIKVIIKMDLDMAKESTALKVKDGMKETGSLALNQETENTAKVLIQSRANGKMVNF